MSTVVNKERYRRQMVFELISETGQEKLLSARVMIAGVGALGSVAANDLCRAGVGFLRLIDRDIVEAVNLQRQILFTEDDAKEKLAKAEAAAEKLRRANSDVIIEPITADINSSNIERFISDVDLVIDGTDNFETRFLLNEACHKHGVQWIYGGVLASGGATMNILQDGGPCFRCFMPDIPAPGSYPTCATAGIVGPVTGIIGSYEAMEAIKILTGANGDISRYYLAIDVWGNTSDYIEIEKNPDCPVCIHGHYDMLDQPPSSLSVNLCGHDAWQVIPKISADKLVIDFKILASRLSQIGQTKVNRFTLNFEGPAVSFTVFSDGRAIIEGVPDSREAEAVYRDYIGG